MAKKRERIQNPQPFLPEEDGASVASTKKRSKPSKRHQNQDKVVDIYRYGLVDCAYCVVCL